MRVFVVLGIQHAMRKRHMVGGLSTPRPGRFTREKDPLPIVQEAGWASGPVWTSAENLDPHRDSTPERPARSESLYRLRYLGPFFRVKKFYRNK